MDRNVNVSDAEAKHTWVKPMLLRLEAGSAEAGANPQAPEGQFASGSLQS
jgi:hypothetical protein